MRILSNKNTNTSTDTNTNTNTNTSTSTIHKYNEDKIQAEIEETGSQEDCDEFKSRTYSIFLPFFRPVFD